MIVENAIPAAATGRQRERTRFLPDWPRLAKSRTLVEVIGSELKVETRPSWGTRFPFEVDLPSCPLPRRGRPEKAPRAATPQG